MIVYQSTKAEFLDNAFKKDIETIVLDHYRRRVGRGASAAEVRSWKESPTIDHLFDKEFISFENKGDLILSPVADRSSLLKMGIKPEAKLNVGAFSEGQRRFLDDHRENVLRMSRRR